MAHICNFSNFGLDRFSSTSFTVFLCIFSCLCCV